MSDNLKKECERKAKEASEALSMEVENGKWFVRCSEEDFIREVSNVILSESLMVQKRVETLENRVKAMDTMFIEETNKVADKQKQIDELKHNNEVAMAVIKNQCEEDTEVRKIAENVLTEFECQGDSYGVPMLREIADLLVKNIDELKAKNAKLELEAKCGNIPYKEAVALKEKVDELTKECPFCKDKNHELKVMSDRILELEKKKSEEGYKKGTNHAQGR